MKLRPYQTAILRQQTEAARDHRRLLVVLATGLGKTEIALSNIQSAVGRGFRVVYLAHREELLTQPAERLQTRGLDHAIVKAGRPLRLSAPVQVCSVQTLARRPHVAAQLAAPKLLVYVDEAHRVAAESYRQVLAAWPEAFVVGQTATPYRLDGTGLHDFFDTIIEGITPAEAIAAGWLIEPTVYAAREPDLTGVRKRGGEYAASDLEERMAVLTGDIVPTWRRLAQGLPTVCFAVSRSHSRAIVEAFTAAGVPAAHIDGTTDSYERRAVLERLAAGELQVVSNVDLLTEGWDGASYARPGAPYVPLSCLIAARPTASMGLWFQMVGRLTRPGKERAVLLDHAGNTRRHGFLRTHHGFSLDGEMQGVSIKGKWRPTPLRRCAVCAAVWPATADRCACGGELGQPREVKQKGGELDLLEPQDAGRKATPAEKAKEYRRLVEVAKAKKYKLGWADVQFKNKFRHWPQPEAKRRVLDELGLRKQAGTALREGAGRFF